MESHRGIAACNGGDDDLAEYISQAGAEGAVDIASMMDDGDRFVLNGEDPLRACLEADSRDGRRHHTVYISVFPTKKDFEIAGHTPGQESRLVVVTDDKGDYTPSARLALETRLRLRPAQPAQPAQPEQQRGILNLGLSVAIFAMMSVTSLAILPQPYSYAVAAGALAPAGIMLTWAARRDA